MAALVKGATMLLQHVSNSQSFQHFKDFAVGQFFDCHSTGFLVTLPPDPLILYPPPKFGNLSDVPSPAFASWTEPPPCEPKWPSCQFSTTELSIWGGGLGGALGGAWVFMNQLLTKLWSFGGLQGCFALLDMSWYLKCRPLKPSIFRIGLGSER